MIRTSHELMSVCRGIGFVALVAGVVGGCGTKVAATPWDARSDADFKFGRDVSGKAPSTPAESSGFAIVFHGGDPSGVTLRRAKQKGNVWEKIWLKTDDAQKAQFNDEHVLMVRAPPGNYVFTQFVWTERDSTTITTTTFDADTMMNPMPLIHVDIAPGTITTVGVVNRDGLKISLDLSDAAKKHVADFVHFRATDAGADATATEIAKSFAAVLDAPSGAAAPVRGAAAPPACQEILAACDDLPSEVAFVARACAVMAMDATEKDTKLCEKQKKDCLGLCSAMRK
ncbi:MAG: hypothetical protein ACHREM_17180 [Polyangiales bacterium]